MKRKINYFVIFILIIGLFVGCSRNKNDNTPNLESETPAFEPSPTIPLNDRVVLILNNSTDSWLIEKASTTLQELAIQTGWEFETRNEISANEISSDIKALIFLSHPENLGSLANSAPNTHFVVITDQEWTPSNNVTVIKVDPTHPLFLSGYASVMFSENFRGGALLNSEQTLQSQAYKLGADYFCGDCKALIFPLNSYPLFKELPSNSQPAEWVTGFNDLYLNAVKFLYVTPSAYSVELFNQISQTDVKIIGIGSPPAEAQSIWAGSFQVDGISPLAENWGLITSGSGGQTINARIYFSNFENGFVSPGRQLKLETVMDELQAGRIHTYDIFSN